jgi:hypothetical protein
MPKNDHFNKSYDQSKVKKLETGTTWHHLNPYHFLAAYSIQKPSGFLNLHYFKETNTPKHNCAAHFAKTRRAKFRIFDLSPFKKARALLKHKNIDFFCFQNDKNSIAHLLVNCADMTQPMWRAVTCSRHDFWRAKFSYPIF